MAAELSFSFRDIPACARYGFSARKIFVVLRTLLLSWLLWTLFVYLGFFAAGSDMSARWAAGKLLPLPDSLFWMDTVPGLILALGVLLIVHVNMRGILAVARIVFQQIRGDNFCSAGDAAVFCRGHWKPLVSVPFMLLFGLALTAAAGAVTGLIFRIPAAGPVIAAVLSLPLWGLMLLGILLVIALLLSLKLVPVIVASTGGDSFEAVFELFSTLTAQSWRLMLYFLLGLLISLLAGAAFLLFASAALTMLSILTGAGSGLAASMAQGPQLLAPEALPFFSGLLSLGGGGESAAWTGAAGVIAALSGTVIFLTVVSYVIASCISSATLSYVVLKYRKDGVDLMERADREEQREFEKLYGGSEKDVK